jgi:hypothetical protein
MWVFYAPQNKNKMGRVSRRTLEITMPKGKGTYGSKVGRPKKKKKGGKKKKSMGGLTAAQKKLPKALQAAILKRKKKKK